MARLEGSPSLARFMPLVQRQILLALPSNNCHQRTPTFAVAAHINTYIYTCCNVAVRQLCLAERSAQPFGLIPRVEHSSLPSISANVDTGLQINPSSFIAPRPLVHSVNALPPPDRDVRIMYVMHGIVFGTCAPNRQDFMSDSDAIIQVSPRTHSPSP